MKLTGKLVLITGGSSGIGEAAAKLLASRGATVVLMARSEQNLKRVANEITEDGGTSHYFPVDLGDHKALRVLVKEVTSGIGVPDIIINSAGAGKWLSVLKRTKFNSGR